LCAVDGDARAPGIVAAARRWAEAMAMRMRVVHVRRPADDDPAPRPEDLGLAGDELRVTSGEPAAALVELILETRPAMVMVASCSTAHPGATRLGRVCAALAGSGAAPVLVMPPGSEASFSGGPIACAVSLGDRDEAALRFANALAVATGRGLALAQVVGVHDAAIRAAARARSAVLGEPGRDGSDFRLLVDVFDDDHLGRSSGDLAVRAGELADRLLDVVRDADADALVMASEPLASDGDGVLSWVSRRLWTAAPCPVIVLGS
jgi:nucleotide-binding universal stress UspA family protein